MTTTRSIRQTTCLICQLKAVRGRSAYVTIAENVPAARNDNLPTPESRKRRLRQLDYDLRHQLLLTTTTDAFKRTFNLKNFEDYWSDERKKRTKVFLRRSSSSKAKLKSSLEKVFDEGGYRSEGIENWEAIERASEENINELVLSQLKSCQSANELLRVVVVALGRDVASKCIQEHQRVLVRVLQRTWNHIKDRRMGELKEINFLKTLNAILSRLRKTGILPHVMLLELALILTFRQASVCSVRSLLREIKIHWSNSKGDWKPSNELLDAVIYQSNLIYSHEIPGANRTKGDIAQLITENAEESQDVCLEMFVDQSRPEVLLRWLRVLGLYGSSRRIWAKWLDWRQVFRNAEVMAGESRESQEQQQIELSTEFVKAFVAQGGIAEAWKIIDDMALKFSSLPTKCQDILLEKLDLATKVDADVQNALLKKYDRDLTQIEQALQVRWVGDDGGYHIVDGLIDENNPTNN